MNNVKVTSVIASVIFGNCSRDLFANVHKMKIYVGSIRYIKNKGQSSSVELFQTSNSRCAY